MQTQENRRSPPGGKSYCAIMQQNFVLSRNTHLTGQYIDRLFKEDLL
jgi:hypothetical protein